MITRNPVSVLNVCFREGQVSNACYPIFISICGDNFKELFTEKYEFLETKVAEFYEDFYRDFCDVNLSEDRRLISGAVLLFDQTKDDIFYLHNFLALADDLCPVIAPGFVSPVFD